MKKIIAVFLTILIIFSNLFLSCYADEISVWDYILSYFDNFYYANNVAPDPDKLIDFWDSDPGKAVTLANLFMRGGSSTPAVIGEFKAIHDLNEASDGRYMVAQLHKDQLDGIHDAFHDYWSSDSAEIRSLPLGDLNLSVNSGNHPIIRFGYTSGSGPAVRYNNSSDFMRFVTNLNYTLNWDALYCYNGTIYYPPVLFVKTGSTLIQGSSLLPGGYYYVLSTTELMYVGDGNFGSDQSIDCFDNDGVAGIERVVCNRAGYYDPIIYEDGVAHTVGVNGDYSYDELIQKYQMSIGLHINCPNMSGDDSYTLKEPPTDVPYDDDDNVVVMLPMDNPGEPVYMSPTTYNTYVNNGNIDNSDDHSNNIVNNEDIDNITNIYNNYITNNNTTNNNYNFDDTNILRKLDTIIGKLDDIINKIDRFNPLSDESSEPIYDNFSDCIFQNVPIADDIHDLIESLNTETSNNGFDDISISNAKTPVASGAGVSGAVDYNNTFSGLGVDMSWYAPYRNGVRDLLKIFVYGFGLVAIWSSVKSVFGIKSDGGSGGA